VGWTLSATAQLDQRVSKFKKPLQGLVKDAALVNEGRRVCVCVCVFGWR